MPLGESRVPEDVICFRPGAVVWRAERDNPAVILPYPLHPVAVDVVYLRRATANHATIHDDVGEVPAYLSPHWSAPLLRPP